MNVLDMTAMAISHGLISWPAEVLGGIHYLARVMGMNNR
jgi:hypothetical protein